MTFDLVGNVLEDVVLSTNPTPVCMYVYVCVCMILTYYAWWYVSICVDLYIAGECTGRCTAGTCSSRGHVIRARFTLS